MNAKEQSIVSLIKAKIRKKNPKAEVILFGSHARGQSHADSDWDILILLDIPHVTHQIEKEYREELFEVELEIGEPISTFVYSKQDWESRHSVTPLYQNIMKEGVIIG
jgi:predicted nucleotidyltransferase